MRILILGGTGFLGQFLTSLLSKNHDLFHFNRGTTKSQLHLSVQTIRGKSPEDLVLLNGKVFDVVIDTLSPEISEPAKIGQSVGHNILYVYISSISAYSAPAPQDKKPLIESSPIGRSEKNSVISEYGLKRAQREREVKENFLNHLIVRPGIMTGPYEKNFGLSYWLNKAQEPGTVMLPGHPDQNFQMIDVRDVSEWIAKSIERGLKGTFNVTSPIGTLTFGEFINRVMMRVNPKKEGVWVPDKFLLQKGVRPFKDIPFWAPQSADYVYRIDPSSAIWNGLTYRAISETIDDTFRTMSKETSPHPFSRDKEMNILEEYLAFNIPR